MSLKVSRTIEMKQFMLIIYYNILQIYAKKKKIVFVCQLLFFFIKTN